MDIQFHIDRNQRKTLAHRIAELTEQQAEYLAAPSFAYQIGGFTLNKDSVLTFSDDTDEKLTDFLLNSLSKEGFAFDGPDDFLTVTMPKDYFTEQTLANLKKLVANKEMLLKHAFDTDSLEITETDENIEFPWFSVSEPEDGDAYCKFISALCDFVKNQKRVNNKPDTSDNEKYAFRCFLLRIGMIGADFKQTRKVLLRNLTGSSAFRHGKPKGEPNHEVSE